MNEKESAKSIKELIDKGSACVHSNPTKCIEYSQKALEISKKSKNEIGIAISLLNIGLGNYYKGNYTETIDCYTKSLKLLRKSDFYGGLSLLLNNFGAVLNKIFDYEKALEYYFEAIEIDLKINQKRNIVLTYSNVANIYIETGNKKAALEYYNKSLTLSKEIGSIYGMCVAYNNVGHRYFEDKKYDSALKFYEKSKELSIKAKKHDILISAYLAMFRVYLATTIFKKAEDMLHKSLVLAKDMHSKEKKLDVNLRFSSLHIARKEYDKAEKLLLNLITVAKEIGVKNKENSIYFELYELYQTTQNPELALEYFTKYHTIKAELDEKKNSDRLKYLKIKFEVETKEKELEIIREKNAELAKKNSLIEKQNDELQEIVEKLHRSEVKYNFVTKEMEKSIGTTLIGDSKAIVEIRKLITLAAESDNINVLITGESGTGKEVVAKNIHKFSRRKKNKFYAVNSSAIPETLFESQFFGHEKNAFTGADTLNIGWFEIADKSTLFLDEIGTLSHDLQVKLLRILEDRKIVRVGSHKEIPVDVKIISATNINLLEKVREDKFRVDLYHRLATYVIDIPPLRERKEDIPLLLRYFVKHFSSKMNKKINRIEEKLENALIEYDFPGNVRELKNMVERAILISNSSVLRTKCFIIPNIKNNYSENEPLLSLEEVEKQQIIKALNVTGFHRQKAADLLKVNRKVIERRIKKFGIEK